MGSYTGESQAGLEGMPSPPPRTAPFCEYVSWLREAERERQRLLSEHEERMRRLRRQEVLFISLVSAFAIGLAAAVAVEFVERSTPPAAFDVEVRQ